MVAVSTPQYIGEIKDMLFPMGYFNVYVLSLKGKSYEIYG